jgi:hypothetical protein
MEGLEIKGFFILSSVSALRVSGVPAEIGKVSFTANDNEGDEETG